MVAVFENYLVSEGITETWPELVHMSCHKAVQSGQIHSWACRGEAMALSAVPSEGFFCQSPCSASPGRLG